MKISLKIRFTIGISTILIIMGIVLNLLVVQVFRANLENYIENSMKDIMKNSREYINYKLIFKNLPFNEQGLSIETGDLSDYIMSSYNAKSYAFDMKGNRIDSSEGRLENIQVDKTKKAALDGKAIVSIQYVKNDVDAILSFPLCYNKEYIGIITINKSYADLYNYNNKTISLITIVEVAVFIIIFIISFILISYTIKPIKSLTNGLKSVGAGDYEINLCIRNKDEIGELTKEFMDMKLKIKTQIDIINSEKEKVLKLESTRNEFFNNVTHELKTPLTAISGYAQMLLDENIEDIEFKNRAMQRIYLESERMHKLVLDLIEVSRGAVFIEEPKLHIDMGKLINEICDDMEIKAGKYSLSLNRNINSGTILGENNKIRQLIINVLDNAIKYSFKNEKIFIKAFYEGKFYVIEVTNKGERIKEEVYKNIFEPFVKGARLVEQSSSGLGLYICNEIVKEHKGQIYIINGDVIKVIVKIPRCGNNLETT